MAPRTRLLPGVFRKSGLRPSMKYCFIVITFFAASAALAEQVPPKVTVAQWPGDRLAAISLTFDDAMSSQLDNAGPILKKHHVNGTFFVSTGQPSWRNRKSEWKDLAQRGNELANHTVHHPCLLPEIQPHSQDYTPEMMEAEIRDAAQEIITLLNWHRGLTFAYPCGNASFGQPWDQVRNASLYLQYVAKYSFGARGAGGGGPLNPDEMSVLTVPDLGPTDGKDFATLLAMAEQGIRTHQWGIYCFHGVGGEWLSISSDSLDQLAAYLELHPEIWTAPFGDVLRYSQERHAASVKVNQSTAAEIDISISWPMDATIYDLPLTLKVEVPSGWQDARVTADGKEVSAKALNQNGETEILIDVLPNTKAVHVEKKASST